MRVIIESPYAGDVKRNIDYTKKCMLDSLSRGESPFASHLLYTQVLDDMNQAERQQGIKSGFEWAEVAHKTAVYYNYGFTPGMMQGIEDAKAKGREIEFRLLKPDQL